MSKYSDLILDIMDEIDLGEMSFSQIAVKYGVSYEVVDAVHNELLDQVQFDEGYRDEAYEVYEAEYPDPDSWYEAQYDMHDF